MGKYGGEVWWESMVGKHCCYYPHRSRDSVYPVCRIWQISIGPPIFSSMSKEIHEHLDSSFCS